MRRFQEEWERGGKPTVESVWNDSSTADSVTTLAALVKADLRYRFARGERPAVADYLDQFPRLQDEHDRVVSLVYEEFCLREENGETIDPERFCDSYEPWRDSLVSQLRYHRLLSHVVAPSTPAPRFPEPGETFQGFRLRDVLGKGGVGRVYLANDPALGDREVALKIAPARDKEPSIQGKLDHNHIVRVFSVTPADPETGLRGLCMPYRCGLSLDEVIRWVDPASGPKKARVLWDALASQNRAEWENGPKGSGWLSFPINGSYAEGVAWIVLVIARALEHAHSQQILHRDIKPANVLLTFRDGPQLLDFNLAHDPHDAERAEAALRGGTLPYMAPEQLEAFLDPLFWDQVGVAADLYGLGLLLRELLTGQRPEAPDLALPLPRAIRELLDRRAEANSSLRQQNRAIPPSLAAIADRCLAYSPKDRYPSAGALIEDLQCFLAHRPLKHTANPSTSERARNWLRRNQVALVGCALLSISLPVGRWLMPKNENTYDTYNNHAVMLIDGGKLDEGEIYLQKALEVNPKDYHAYQNLAAIADKRKDFTQTIDYLSKAIGYLSEAIPVREGDKRQASLNNLCALYMMRAGAAVRRGDQIRSKEAIKKAVQVLQAENSRNGKSAQPQEMFQEVLRRLFPEAEPFYLQAEQDVETARRIGRYRNTMVAFHTLAWGARAQQGLGEVASLFDRYQESVPRFKRSIELFTDALELRPGSGEAELQKDQDDARERLRIVKEERLAVDEPQLEKQRRQQAEGPASPQSGFGSPVQLGR